MSYQSPALGRYARVSACQVDVQDPEALCLHLDQDALARLPLGLGRHPGNFLARVKLTLKLLTQWVLGRGNSQNSFPKKLP